jgi:hypothetical protein
MTSIVKQASAIVECAAQHRHPGLIQQAGCSLAPQLEACATLAHEKFLARETGTILIFVVGLCRGRPNQLDWRTQLLCPK